MIKENWDNEINAKVDENLAETNEKDLRFFRIAEFKRNISRVNKYSNSCSFCSKYKIDIEDAVKSINEAINMPGKERRSYDRLISSLSAHMRKEHGFYPPYYFSYLISFYGIVSGIFLGYLLVVFVPGDSEAMFITGFSVCLIAGYVWGSRKDSKIRFEKRLM
ncbi:MAG: hypothetical protein JXR61_00320 [Prolixibacteraceae bacterium]|nr:hypothetical protein [Prolixibacteraceae bacterium]